MSNDLDTLRRVMANLAEQAGDAGGADLYDRALYTSRRLARRQQALAAAAVLAVMAAVGVPVALRAGTTPVPPEPADAPPIPSASASVPTPTGTPSQIASPRAPTKRATKDTPTRTPTDDGCPVSAARLRAAADLSKGWRIDASTMECSHGWAVAGLTAPSPELQGDGVTIFRYHADTKTWKTVGEGSAIDCAEWGIPKEARVHLSICNGQT